MQRKTSSKPKRARTSKGRPENRSTLGTSRVVGTILEIPLAHIQPFEGQPRTKFEAKQIAELAESIRIEGQLNPAQVIVTERKGRRVRYELVDGERRYRAALQLGLKTLRCEVVTVADREAQFARSFVLNFHRVDHTPLEIALSCARMLKSGNKTQSQIAAAIGKSELWVSMYLRLLNLVPELAILLGPETPEERRPRLTAMVPITRLKPEIQVEVFERIGGIHATQRKAENEVRSILESDPDAKHPEARLRETTPHDHFKRLDRFLQRLFEDTRHWAQFPDVLRLFEHRRGSPLVTAGRLVKASIRYLQALDVALSNGHAPSVLRRKF